MVGDAVTVFSPAQLLNARLLCWLVDQYVLPVQDNNPPRRVKWAVVNCAFTEASLINLNSGDAGSSSVGFFQQTAGYGPLIDRLHPPKTLDMFLSGGPQGQPAFLKQQWQRGDYPWLCRQIQAVQGSQFDGRTVDPSTGRPYVYADNYVRNINVTNEILAAIGIPLTQPQTVAQQIAPIIAALQAIQ